VTDLTITVTTLTRRVLDSSRGVGLDVDLIASGLLFLLLVEYAMVRAHAAPRLARALWAFAVPISSLLIVFAIVIATRWWELHR
jgi:hypothetical protein